MTRIYGGSDDLIEIDGDIEDEVNKIDAKNLSIKCSDGTKARITYDENGEWIIEVIEPGRLIYKHYKSVGDELSHPAEIKDCTSYSDVLVFSDGLEWVKIGSKTFKA